MKRLFNKIKKVIKEKEYKKLTNDPKYQSILKKHNLEPVPYGKDISFSELRKLQRKTGRIKSKKEIDEKIAKGKLWLGMTEEELILMKGKPEKKTESVSRNNTKEEFYYDGYKNRQGNISYKLKVVLIDGEVEKWTSN